MILALTGWEVGSILGGMNSVGAKIVYILVGLAALYELVTHKKCCKMCEKKKMGGGNMPMQEQNQAQNQDQNQG